MWAGGGPFVVASDRLLNCARCQRQLRVCRSCDRGQRYCRDPCARRERQVILRLAERGRAVGIAAELGVSASTVNTHVQCITEKLGVRSVVEIVDFARDHAVLS